MLHSGNDINTPDQFDGGCPADTERSNISKPIRLRHDVLDNLVRQADRAREYIEHVEKNCAGHTDCELLQSLRSAIADAKAN